MATVDNNLLPGSFESVGSTGIEIESNTSQVIRFRGLTAISLVVIPATKTIGQWRLRKLLLAELRSTRSQSVATTWLEGIVEYGVGRSEDRAVTDLVNSLGEYRESLEKRRSRLGKSARADLSCLKKTIERTS